MSANGTFEVELEPQADVESPAGRMLISKVYQGDMRGSGTGQMISKRTENGTAVYYAIEEFSGSVKGMSGGLRSLTEAAWIKSLNPWTSSFSRVQAAETFETSRAG